MIDPRTAPRIIPDLEVVEAPEGAADEDASAWAAVPVGAKVTDPVEPSVTELAPVAPTTPVFPTFGDEVVAAAVADVARAVLVAIALVLALAEVAALVAIVEEELALVCDALSESNAAAVTSNVLLETVSVLPPNPKKPPP